MGSENAENNVTEDIDLLTAANLAEVVSDFEASSRRAIEGVLGIPTFCHKPFVLTSELNSSASVSYVIQSFNTKFSVTLLMGINKSDYSRIIPSGTEEDIIDTIGEITNVLAGHFLSRPSYTNRFGHMVPSPPVLLQEVHEYKKAGYISGVLVVNSIKIFMGFIIKTRKRTSLA